MAALDDAVLASPVLAVGPYDPADREALLEERTPDGASRTWTLANPPRVELVGDLPGARLLRVRVSDGWALVGPLEAVSLTLFAEELRLLRDDGKAGFRANWLDRTAGILATNGLAVAAGLLVTAVLTTPPLLTPALSAAVLPISVASAALFVAHELRRAWRGTGGSAVVLLPVSAIALASALIWLASAR